MIMSAQHDRDHNNQMKYTAYGCRPHGHASGLPDDVRCVDVRDVAAIAARGLTIGPVGMIIDQAAVPALCSG